VYLLDIASEYKDSKVTPIFSRTLLGEQVAEALQELIKSKTELELLELFEKAK